MRISRTALSWCLLFVAIARTRHTPSEPVVSGHPQQGAGRSNFALRKSRFLSLKCELFRSGRFCSDKRMNSYRELDMTPARPLRSTGITPLPHYYGPLRLPTGQRAGLLIPLPPPGYDPEPAGSPRFLDPSVAARHPLPPRQAAPVHPLVASRSVLASASLAAWPPAICVSRPLSVQPLTAYGSQLRCRRLAPPRPGPFPNRPRSPYFVASARQTAATCITSNLHGNHLSGC